MKKYNKGTDTVPAMLSPHEAVLNRNAADMLGRGKIRKLNAMGNAIGRYQEGTSDVQDQEDQSESMMMRGHQFTPQELARMQKMRESQGEEMRKMMMNEKPMMKFQSGTSDVSERKGLLNDIEGSFYGGGQAAAPTPTPAPSQPWWHFWGKPSPTPEPRKYQYGTSNVKPFGYGNYSQPSNFGFNYAQGNVGMSQPSLSGTSNPSNVSAFSGGVMTSPFGNPSPNLAYANPETLSRLNISNLIYSPGVGGYLTRADQASNYRPQGGDPNANRQASAFWNYIGSLPTRPIGTPALNQLYQSTGQQFPAGPPLNQIWSNTFNSLSPYMQNQARQAGFGSTFAPFRTGTY